MGIFLTLVLMNDAVINQLHTFIRERKFSDAEWESRGLNPSSQEMSDYLEGVFNDVAENLVDAIKSNLSQKKLISILKDGLKAFRKADYDTEEKEFICEVFNNLSKIISVDFVSNLNKWLYGSILSSLFKIGQVLTPEKLVFTLQQPCVKCGIELETHVKKIEDGIPDNNWFIVKCDSCNELNLLTLEPNIKELTFGNYKLIENLFKQDYTYEQAQARLEQIKLNRK